MTIWTEGTIVRHCLKNGWNVFCTLWPPFYQLKSWSSDLCYKSDAPRSHPHTPGRYPLPFTNSFCFGISFFVGVWGSFPGALWAKSLRCHFRFRIHSINVQYMRLTWTRPPKKLQPQIEAKQFGHPDEDSRHRLNDPRLCDLGVS